LLGYTSLRKKELSDHRTPERSIVRTNGLA
jgi:hypothetical protein